jgi:hypothetical protein
VVGGGGQAGRQPGDEQELHVAKIVSTMSLLNNEQFEKELLSIEPDVQY